MTPGKIAAQMSHAVPRLYLTVMQERLEECPSETKKYKQGDAEAQSLSWATEKCTSARLMQAASRLLEDSRL